jgi:hypothetical protein
MISFISRAPALRRRALWRCLPALIVSLAWAACPAVSASTLSPDYDVSEITNSGDLSVLAPLRVPATADLLLEGLADSGLVTFSAAATPGGLPSVLLQWGNDQANPLVVPGGGRSPHWPLDVYWPQDVVVDRPVGVNARGDVVFSVDSQSGAGPWATYWWDGGNQTAIPVRLTGGAATGDGVFTHPGGVAPALNNRDEITLIGEVRSASGTLGYGLFFLEQLSGEDPALRPVLLPGDSLMTSTGGRVPAVTSEYFRPSIDDSGRIAFLAQLQGATGTSAYVWEWGQNDPVMVSGAALRRGVSITDVVGVWLNDQDRSALAAAATSRTPGRQYGLYRAQDGRVTPLVEPGAAMPGGGTLQTIQFTPVEGTGPPLLAVSDANAAGQCAFLATLSDGSSALYRLDPDGARTPVLQTDAPPAPGDPNASAPDLTFTPGSRPCINGQGQIAVSARRGDGTSVLLLLTPG